MSVKSFISRYLTVFRIIAAIIAFALIGVLLWGANDLLGNPISYSIAKKNAQKYIAEKYAADGYVLEGVSYSFKFKDYLAHVAKNNSEDCRFTVFFGMDGSFRGDNYESLVQNGSNIRRRLDMSYRELVDSVLESPAYPYSTNIAYGSLIFEGDEDKRKEKGHDFALPDSILVPDALYNITELGGKAGLLTIYVSTEKAATPENAADILLEIKTLMEQAGVMFYAIDLTLQSSGGDYIIENFHRSDIYEDGLAERIWNIGLTTDEYNAKYGAERKDY